MRLTRSTTAWKNFLKSVLEPVCRDQPCDKPILAKGRCSKHYYAWKWRCKQEGVKEEREDATV